MCQMEWGKTDFIEGTGHSVKKGVGEEMACAGKKAQAIFICMFTLSHGGGCGGGDCYDYVMALEIEEKCLK